MILMLALARNLVFMGLLVIAFSLAIWLIRRTRWSAHPAGARGLLTDLVLSNVPMLLAMAVCFALEDWFKGVVGVVIGIVVALVMWFCLRAQFGPLRRASDRADLTRALPRAGDAA